MGHEAPYQRLLAAFEAGRLAHAVLLAGPEGVGKATLARAVARVILCLGTASSSARACASCRPFDSNQHPDLHVLAPPEGKRGIDIDQVRGCIRDVSLQSALGRGRVVLVDGADLVGEEAGNALLKLLEEPPPRSHFFLCTSNPSSVLETLRSRCQTVLLGPVPEPAIGSWLIRKGVPADRAPLLAALSGGSPGLALRYHEEDGLDARNLVLEAAFGEDDPFARARRFRKRLADDGSNLEDQRARARRGLGFLLTYLRDVRSAQTGQDPRFHPELAPAVKQHAQSIGEEAIERAFWTIVETHEAIARNANLDLLLDALFAKLSTLFQATFLPYRACIPTSDVP